MAISKVERLMNLVICLLSTRQYVSAERIRSSVAGYSDSPNDEAFARMFERDKNELRDLGIPLETGPTSQFSSVEGYRIDRGAYFLPAIDLDSDEAAAVAVAAQLWESPQLSAAVHSALLKLRAAGVQVDTEAGPANVGPMPVRTRASEPALGALLAAIESGRAVRFGHRPERTAQPTTRTVDPWGVVTANGRWYLVGFDHDREAVRTFRISRIEDDVRPFGPLGAVQKPAEANLQQIVAAATGMPRSGPVGTARVWVADDRAVELRRLGTVVEERTVGGRRGSVVEFSVRSPNWVARLICGYGPDALVIGPEDLRTEVRERLQRAIGSRA
ncbi:helix-turn-helix transcriptional regulator [Millisia brevis]|uniref:helix-turn-helix transcriptional regulator n=1 Tax=Millisia brevis TaxID=264148 RepID=UPI00082D1FEE|nr:WYL domain-containing protein [Millisia brevis]